METDREMELYIHIPFCRKKCNYCDFLSFPAGQETMDVYVQMLIKEIREAEKREEKVTSVFLGGGTPSILSGQQMHGILDTCREKFSFSKEAEITLEANPGTLDQGKLKALRQAGINRLSLGLQSAHNGELRELGRIHTWEDFLESYHMARKAGFRNINVDLMSALPAQTPESFRDTLKQVTALEPEHISAYSLIIEEGTPFYEKYACDERDRQKDGECAQLPSEEEERSMYADTARILRQAGYRRYEISNYAREGFECRHNCGYWTRKSYRGFGLGAASLMDETRYHGTEDLQEYLRGSFPRLDQERLSLQARMEETMFLGLRLTRGVSIKEFNIQFGCSIWDVYGKVSAKLTREGLLQEREGWLSLTEKGIDVSNYVLSEFLL